MKLAMIAAAAMLAAYGGAAATVKEPLDVPVKVYDDVSHLWCISGYMGKPGNFAVKEWCEENPHSGKHCIRIRAKGYGSWGGIMWQDPPNDWGESDGGYNLSKANTLVFWARGEKGGEKVNFYCGGLCGRERFKDSGSGGTGNVTLTKEWRRYRIALDWQDLTRIKTPFAFTVGADEMTFYLDDIEYIFQ
ncbi:MAG: hypothetical protein IJ802_06665 [Kiritimatiellae bacterium]|nr:hypothetical protein [Kiritimatiellia bacterium]